MPSWDFGVNWKYRNMKEMVNKTDLGSALVELMILLYQELLVGRKEVEP